MNGSAVDALVGAWALERRIDDRRRGAIGSFLGTANVARIPGATARYEESGELRFGPHATAATRSLLVAATSATSVAWSFPDGRPFVEVDLDGSECHRVHCCGADRYEITYCFGGEWAEEHWSVVGPHKRYEATTRLVRA